MNRKKPSKGPFADSITQYLQLRRSLGLKLIGAESTLRHFDYRLSQHSPQAKTVTKAMILDYLRSLSHLQATTLYLHFMYLRQFCRFLFKLNPDTYVPETAMIRRGRTIRKPHLYTKDEITGIIKLAAALPPKGSLRSHTFNTLFSLLWVSGLRIGEALRLNLEDVDTDNAVLHIRESKFFKSRLVPLTESSASALKAYKRRRAHHGQDQRPDAPFFVNMHGKRFCHSTVNTTFRRLTRQLSIKTAQGYDPRLHDWLYMRTRE